MRNAWIGGRTIVGTEGYLNELRMGKGESGGDQEKNRGMKILNNGQEDRGRRMRKTERLGNVLGRPLHRNGR